MLDILKNWKTTLSGVITIAIAIASLVGVQVAGQNPIDAGTAAAMIISGIGLIFAKDFNTPAQK